MVSVRAAKAKGSAFEYDCQESLEQKYDSVTRTSERGYQRQYDLHIALEYDQYIAVECKRLKGISWNQLEKIWAKLNIMTPTARYKYVIFKSNHQPALVFFPIMSIFTIQTFEDFFNIPFVKHKSTRAKPKIASISSKIYDIVT